MIVGSYFHGDEDMATAWKQHDVYSQGLSIIVSTCNRLTRFARELLDDDHHEPWGYVARYDHRVLQSPHDLLAAAWRYKHDLRQGVLPFEQRPDFPAETTADRWLLWLSNEVMSWSESPGLVRQVQVILEYQNQPIGDAAESALCLALLDRFYVVPWRESQRTAFETDLANFRAKICSSESERDNPDPREPKLPEDNLCECHTQGRSPCGIIPCKSMTERARREGWGPLE